MQSRLATFSSLVFACVVWASGSISAQPPASESPAPPRVPAGDLIRESDLKIRLVDENGNLVAVPGFPLEEFRELLALKSRLKEQQAALPKAVFTGSIEVTGSVDSELQFASLEVTYRIRVTARPGVTESTLTAIPLRLDKSFVDVGAIQHDEQGEIYVTKDEAAYVCWLHAAPDTTHTIHVPLKVPVRSTGTQNSLNLTLPNMAAKLRLTVADDTIEPFIPSGRSNVSWETGSGTTVITVESGGGELDLAWRKRGQVLPHAVEATCSTTVHVHGNYIWSEAQLKVRSRAEPIDSFIVRLPDGMELTSRSDADFQISPLPASDENGRQEVLVKRLGGSTRGPIEVHLESALPPIAAEMQRRTVQLAGFSVQDAVREWGSVDVILDGNWLPTWLVGQFVQRVAVLEDASRQPPIAARFLYDRQPYSLRLELRPKQSRGSFETTYVVDVAAEAIQLDARIAYVTNGAKVDSLSFKLPGWTIDAVTPPESLAKPFTFEDGILTLPINTAATELDFHLRAQRPIEPDATDVSFDLPRPTDAALLPNATLIVLAADNVELTPELASMKWLIQETRPPAVELPARFAAPLLFREELSTENNEAARFVARRRIRPRETTVTVASDAILKDDLLQVRQSFTATVAYAPLAEMTIAVPTSVAAAGTLRIFSGEQELAYREITPPAPAPPSAPQTTPVPHSLPNPKPAEPTATITTQPKVGIVDLPAPVTGEFQIDVSFEIPRKDIVGVDGLRIPLVQPAGDEATEDVTNVLTISSDERTAISLLGEAWSLQSDGASPANGKHELRLRATGVMREALVQATVVESRRNGSTSISRIWIQSWLMPTDRSDRVCFQLLCDQPLIQIQLPPTAQMQELQVRVDGKAPIEFVDHGDQSLTITLADEQVGHVVGLELGYFSEPTGGSRFRVATPTIIDADRAERVYWQIVLPRGQHLAWPPATVNSELVWQRDQWYWGRRGRLEQRALEQLVGASTQDPVSPNTNRYLFSSTGSLEEVEFVKVSRLTLMMISSGLVLLVVLPFIYLPGLRQPAVFFFVGVMLCGVAVTYPDYSAMLGQTGAIGLGLAIAACVLHRLVGRSPMTPVTRRSSVYITPDSHAAGVSVRVAEGSSHATTATAPAHLQVAQVEGDS